VLPSNANEPNPARSLLRLSDSLAEGNSIDWDAELAETPENSKELTNLRRLEALRQAFSLPIEDRKTVSAERKPGDVPTQWGHLVIQKLLGVGAFAEVYLAYDPKLDTQVALKLLKRDRIAAEGERFLWEARHLAHVRHPHVVTVHGFGEHDGRPGLWMDYLPGQSLDARFAERGRLGWREAAAIGVEMCGALAAIHAAGLAHGDVKGTNVVQADDGRNVLTDFGAAGDRGTSGLLQSGACGTPLVMAPELFLNRMQATPAGDIYSLGVLLYRLVSGSYPVEATTEAELYEKHERAEHVRLRDRCPTLPAPFVAAVEQALAPDPHARFGSAGRLEEALLHAAKPIPWWHLQLDLVVEKLTLAVGWTRKRPRRSALTLAMTVVAVTLLVMRSFLPLKIQTVVYRMEAGVPKTLGPGAAVHPGDSLCMQFRGSRDSYVYVVNEAERTIGELNTLFPLSYSDLANPLSRGKNYLLPGRAGSGIIPWPLDDTGGKERILVIASREPLAKFEEWTRDAADPIRGIDPQDPRGIHVTPPPSSRIDRIKSELGPPNRNMSWQVVELECDAESARAKP